jgi:hypothetical protein
MKNLRHHLSRAGRGVVATLDLSHLAPVRDLLLAVGFGCVVYGVARLSVAAAWMFAGLGLMAASLAMATPPTARKPKA